VDARERYDEVAAYLEARDPDVELGQMMGMPAIKYGGKLIAGYSDGSMAFKLPDEGERERALALEGAELFDPSRQGRVMRQWVAVPLAHAAKWEELVDTALRLRKESD
jgi:hypothetical protein